MWLILLTIGSFFLGLATDWIWTRWMQNVAANNPIVAANWSVLVYVVGLMYTMLIIGHAWVPIAFYLVGGWIGTYLAVRKHD
jgi:hypothetical protein